MYYCKEEIDKGINLLNPYLKTVLLSIPLNELPDMNHNSKNNSHTREHSQIICECSPTIKFQKVENYDLEQESILQKSVDFFLVYAHVGTLFLQRKATNKSCAYLQKVSKFQKDLFLSQKKIKLFFDF